MYMLFPPACPWFVNEMGEPVTVAPPPPYSYDPNGNDLPRGQSSPPVKTIHRLFANMYNVKLSIPPPTYRLQDTSVLFQLGCAGRW